MKRLVLIVLLAVCLPALHAQHHTYPAPLGPEGFSVVSQDASRVELNFSVHSFDMAPADFEGAPHTKLLLPGHFLYTTEGMPDLPGSSRYILVPEGAEPELRIIRSRAESFSGIDIMPAPKIPTDDQDGPLVYFKDSTVYSTDARFPASPVMMKTGLKMRGMNVVRVTVVPFQYNPVTRDLIVYRDLRVEVNFKGGTGEFGIEKYRSRAWDPILRNHLLNGASLPETDHRYTSGTGNRTLTGCEYLIICPNGAVFQQWADSIRAFRTEQGILTDVMTLAEVGGNTTAIIETFVNNAFNTWDIPPSAILLLADHGTDAQNSIPSVTLNNHPGGYNPFVSDNIYADVDGDDLPDIAFARITARNAAELELMVHKFMDYERNPPTNPDFYDHPITALGWQTERWFQICSETIGGFLKNELGKNPVRINEVYGGNPATDPWSTASNTTSVLNYFGPSGQGYIPTSPTTLGSWTGGNATQINNAVNAGSFLLQHRDHGAYYGWGEPSYSTSNISGLTNTDLTFVMSINCQTGKFEYGTETFTERFHRYQYNGGASGAVGLIAATEVSYSFVNDVYTWGMYDYMWPDFMPTFGSNPAPGGLMPAFGNVAGKYHLVQSTWVPGYSSLFEITCNLFHHHGDAYLELFSEVPVPLTVAHAAVILSSESTFTVSANAGALIALTSDGVILGKATATGAPQSIPIEGSLVPGDEMVVTVTLTNHLRYRAEVGVIAPTGPYVIFAGVDLDDSQGNNNGQLDAGETAWLSIGLQNVGTAQANGVGAEISSADPFIVIPDSVAVYGTIATGDTVIVSNGFQITASTAMPDGHPLVIGIVSTNGTDTWNDDFSLVGHAPELVILEHAVDDATGNGNGAADPGEAVMLDVPVKNNGSIPAIGGMLIASTSDPYITLITPSAAYGDILPGDTATQAFGLEIATGAPAGHNAVVYLQISAGNYSVHTDSIALIIGRIPALVLDLDPNTSSGPAMVTAMQFSGVDADYSLSFPADLSVYQSVFCCLGIYSTNHVLTQNEGQLLADYLDDGGALYLEGGDTWAYDPETPVYSYFRIDGQSDGSADMVTVTGQTGTFTSGMSFSYGGANSYMDRLLAISPAVIVLKNSSPVYNTCIAYNAGSYRTIGSSHEFGGLTDNTSFKRQLMARYLEFLGVAVTCNWQGTTAEWNLSSNWSNRIIPGSTMNACIPYNPAAPYPTQFSGGTAACRFLEVEPGAVFTVPAGTTLTIGD